MFANTQMMGMSLAFPDVCLTPVYTRKETLADPHLAERGVFVRGSGITYVTAPGVGVRPAPALGADTDDVLDAAKGALVHIFTRNELRSYRPNSGAASRR